jgi:hypothetical protein
MARRKQKHLIKPQTFLGWLAILGVLFLVVRFFESMPSGTGTVLASVVLLTIAAAIAYLVIRLIRRANARRALLQKARGMTEQQLEPLLRRRAQLVRLDPYGKPKVEKWAEELDYFLTQHIQPLLTTREVAALQRTRSEVAEIISSRVEVAAQSQPAFRGFSEDMSPTEYETFCAEELRHAGWDARVTMQSRDQGVDVIAGKPGRRIVFQCKLYARAVGNKAVQEAVAARAHEQAEFGAVVSNNRYTNAAEELAATNGILLLHHRDLQNLDAVLDRHRGRSA